MDLKVIMVPFGGDDSEIGAMRTAFALAKAHSAHVEVWHITPNPYNMSTLFYPGQGLEPIYSEDILLNLKNAYEESTNIALNKFSRVALEMGVELEDGIIPDYASASFHHMTGSADEIISMRSRLCDLAVISRATSEDNSLFHGIVYNALFESARPVLLIPPGKSLNLLPSKIIIAWNNSVESSRAVALSFPLLEQAKVWVWAGDRGNEHSASEGDILRYLKMHGTIAEELLPNATTPESLLMTAKTLGASMIVMGAYSHNRFRETILGGMTNFMLKNSTIPVFMAH